MKHSSTWDLLDLAEDYDNIAKEFIVHGTSGGRYLSALAKLVEIDEELLSRVPEGEFVTMLGNSGNPVGFEPYMGEDNEYLSYLAIERQATQSTCYHEWIEGYYGLRCSKCGAFVADGHGPWMPVDELGW